MPTSLKDLRGKVKRPVRSVTLCVDGDLSAKHRELTEKLDSLRAARGTAMMGDDPAAREVQGQITEVEAAMRDAQVTIEFRGISMYRLEEIKERFPAKDGRGWDVNAGSAALIAACSVEPVSEDDVKGLLEELNVADSDKLFSAAWEATTRSDDVPFGARASVPTPVSA